jgi:hypothetical protein
VSPRRDINIATRAPSLRTQWQVAIGESDLPPTSRLVAWALSTWMDADGRCWPAQREIARRAGASRRAVINALENLRESDFLSWKTGGGPRRPNQYQALMSAPGAHIPGMSAPDDRTSASDDTFVDHARHERGRGSYQEVSNKKSEETSANSQLRGSPPQSPTELSADAPWKDYDGGWRAYLRAETQRRSEEEGAEEASEAREGQAI